jgi:hypothetical protein
VCLNNKNDQLRKQTAVWCACGFFIGGVTDFKLNPRFSPAIISNSLIKTFPKVLILNGKESFEGGDLCQSKDGFYILKKENFIF